ncbi:hypothetical protein QI078_13020, partial [Staphylococcus saprophyticus]|nr:hypothetical protein [Staphylococcus saprophyticus]
MPWTLQAIKEDMHLILFDGTITLEGEHAVRIDEHKIRGDRMVVPFDTFKQIGKPRNQNDIH